MANPIELEDLMTMSGKALHAIMQTGRPLDLDSMAGQNYLGTDLSMPRIGQKILWQTFRKTFVRDEVHGDVRGWNVRMEQHGIDGPRVPIRNKNGDPKTFAHYRVRSAEGLRFPKGWKGAHYFDYTIAGNGPVDRWGFTPVVAVNEGNSDLLLGWEVFKFGRFFVAPPLYWAIKADGPVDHVVDPPRSPKI